MKFRSLLQQSAMLTVLLVSCASRAQIYDSSGVNELTLDQAVSSVTAGTILVIGEVHGKAPVRDQQLSILNALRTAGHKVSVGMEFFYYTDQDVVQDYRKGLLTNEQLIKAVGWTGFDIGLYTPQLLFPRNEFGEAGLAINSPKSLTRQISQQGLAGLTDEQKKLMPPDYLQGNENYRERFYNIMSGGHVPDSKLDNYFQAQSTWDETMAWKSLEFMKDHSDQVFVIIVGEFHVQYGGGLPASLIRRIHVMGLAEKLNVKTISQISTEGLTTDEIIESILPSIKYGPRSDYLFLVSP